MREYLNLENFCEAVAVEHPANQLYCLADHAGMPGLHRELLRSGTPWVSLFQGDSEEAALAAAPLLFALIDQGKRANGNFLQWVAAHGTYTSSMLMLSSPVELGELSGRLARRMDARVSEQMDVLFRYFDPRVFESLLAVLEEQQRRSFLQPADTWWYLNRSGELVREQSIFLPDDIDSTLLLSASQEFALLDACEIDQVAAQLQSMMPDFYISMDPGERVSFLRGNLAATQAVGIVATNEVVLYCGLALLHGEDFAQTPPWQELLAKVAARSIGFVDAVAAQDE